MSMIIKSRKKLPLLTSDTEKVLPVLSLRSAVIFPGEIHTIQVGRKENLAMLDAVVADDNQLILSFSPQPETNGEPASICQVGVVARVQSVISSMGDSKMVTLEGIRRAAIMDVDSTAPFLTAAISEVRDDSDGEKRWKGPVTDILQLVSNLAKIDNRYANELVYNLKMSQSSPGKFADRVGAMVHFHLADKQEIIEAVDIQERLDCVMRLVRDEIEKISISIRIDNRVTESLERKKRESYLRQQLMEIRRELGEEFVEEDVARSYQNQINANKGLPSHVAGRLLFEAGRLKHLSSSSTDYGTTKNYMDLLLSLPWDAEPPKPVDLIKVEESLNAGYYGLAKIKEQVLEYLAIRQLSRDVHDVPILCLAGAVGTGKASLVKAIASSLGRQFMRINGTSMIVSEDIKGSNRNEFGSSPGQLVRALRRAGTFDIVVYLEDLEYVVESEDINALLALMEAVDPRQNSHFVDNFVGIPIDLSRVLFVLGISSTESFPEPFLHRLEMVEMPGYIEKEKITITKRHILPKLYKRHGLARTELKFTDKALTRIIRQYTMEAGLIMLQQQLEKIFRRVARRKAACQECKYTISEKDVEGMLGTAMFIPEKAMSEPEIGVANGLAWTGAGGDLMIIEGLKMRGTGQVIYTGSLGEVMKESIQAAHSFVRSRADTLGIDHNDFVNFDVHVHFPMGAIPKDGPSAGVTVSMVIASVMAERPIKNDIAMTGEVTLRGKVISVGGVKEKVSAAYRAGIHTIILPKDNEKDLKDLPKEIIRKSTFIFIESVDELFEQGLQDFTPSTFTLEKILAEEIEKAQKRGRSRKKTKTTATKKPSQGTKRRKKKPA